QGAVDFPWHIPSFPKRFDIDLRVFPERGDNDVQLPLRLAPLGENLPQKGLVMNGIDAVDDVVSPSRQRRRPLWSAGALRLGVAKLEICHKVPITADGRGDRPRPFRPAPV